MNYEQFLEQMKEDLQARFAENLPPEYADISIVCELSRFVPAFSGRGTGVVWSGRILTGTTSCLGRGSVD